FVRSLAQYILQVSIEEEATTFLGREHYRRGGRLRMGWRNGYEPKRVQSEAGLMQLAVPQLRATEERFGPELVERLGSRSVDLEGLVRGMYVRGLSTQDVKDLYGETFGESRLSKSTVSRITQQLNGDFEAWRKRDLSDLNVVYLFLDGQYHAARQGTDEKEGVLSAYAILEDGRPVLLHLDLGPRESYDAVEFSPGHGCARGEGSAAGGFRWGGGLAQSGEADVAAVVSPTLSGPQDA